ncbi:tyrosine-type recombinase/integrase [Alteromonas flava]|uniref:tyrosine-type recombinase/integrase n=1 Tax=Alteromonas flava TaxID=2048003 RepID=UPI000C294D8D|nr:tyrosine-type recombinase/integrase [Alteromonas flava]
MGRTTKPLSATQVENAKPKEKEYNLSDGQGLHLRVRPNGSKSWLFNYSCPSSKKRTNIGLGKYPVVSLSEARILRNENLRLLAGGTDPKEHRLLVKEEARLGGELTFRVVAYEWLALQKTRVKSNTREDIEKSLIKNVFPFIGEMPIAKIGFRHIKHDVVERIIGRNSLEIARKVARRINQVMTFALLNEYIDYNPARELSKLIPSSQQKNLPALSPEQLPELMRAAHFSTMTLQTRCLFEWQLHTMTRPGEAASAEWFEISLKERMWIIPADKMKAGREHKIPLTESTIKILKLMKPISGHRKFVFPSMTNPNSHMSNETINRALKRMGFEGRTVAHGLRSLASTTLNEQGFDPNVIEMALAHKDPDRVRAAYNRAEYLKHRCEMMMWWSQHIIDASNKNLNSVIC